MLERLLVLTPDDEGRVVIVDPGNAPPGRPIDKIDVAAPCPCQNTAIPNRRVRTQRWMTEATSALLATMLSDRSLHNAAQWWSGVLNLSDTDAEQRRLAHAEGLRLGNEEIERRIAAADEHHAIELANLRDRADEACAEYARTVMDTLARCQGRIAASVEACENAMKETTTNARELVRVRTQLRRAAQTPVDDACGKEWRRRIEEIIDEEFERVAREGRRGVDASLEDARARDCAPKDDDDPALPFAHVPVIAGIVRAFARQVDILAIERLLRHACLCASWVGATLCDDTVHGHQENVV
jgi:hypothetical protein